MHEEAQVVGRLGEASNPRVRAKLQQLMQAALQGVLEAGVAAEEAAQAAVQAAAEAPGGPPTFVSPQISAPAGDVGRTIPLLSSCRG